MARMLGRSRSLRMLRGGRNDTHQQDAGNSTPPPISFAVESDRLKAATPVTRTDGHVQTPDMLQRPKTSGGPGDRGKTFHKKVAPVIPGSEDLYPHSSFPSPNKSSTTILYTAELHESREGIIGIALGSPTMNSHWNTTPHATDFVTSNPGTVTHITSNPTIHEPSEMHQAAPKPKLSRWKSIFGKKPQPQEQKASFYQLAQSVMPERVDSHHDNESLDSRTLSGSEDFRDDSQKASPPTFKPEIRESRKMPKGSGQPPIESRPRALTASTNSSSKGKPSLMRSATSPKPPPKDDWNKSPNIPQLIVPTDSHNEWPRMHGDKGLLDVDIPDITMERYSVMFGNLLQPNSNRSSSLLVRRQGNAERLKPLNELSVKSEEDSARNGLKPQRRATSPSFPKSPLSLFPRPTSRAPSPRAVTLNRPRPLQRSRTAPATSPSRQSFPISQVSDDGVKEKSQDPKSRDHLSENEDFTSKSQLLTPTPSLCHSFDSDSEEVPIVVGGASGVPWKPRMAEPEWEIVSKPALVSRPSQRSALRSHPPNAPLEQGPSSAPLESHGGIKSPTPIIEPAPLSADRAVSRKQEFPSTQRQNETQAATVGVARSVSVSRASPRSAELLKPTLVKRATERSISPSQLSPSDGRIVDQKPLTPTLVELKNRKSQRVQLVDA